MKFGISGVSLFGIPNKVKLNICRNAGFDGIELLVTANKTDWLKVEEAAKKMGISTSYHQSWSLEENPTHLVNKVLDGVGILPKKGYTLGNLFGGVPVERPIVVYADRVWDFSDTSHSRRYQTVSVFSEGSYKLSYLIWAKLARNLSHGIVFDTQHVLEYKLNLRGVEDLVEYPEEELFCILTEAWSELGGSQNIKEIHWNDCSPALGHTAGRNVPLGTGVLPLQEFAEFIRKDGFDGLVIPEVKPTSFLTISPRKLRGIVESYF